MKQFIIILKYELKEYLAAKGFVIFTLLLAILGAGLLFLPRFIDLSDFTGVKIVAEKNKEEQEAEKKDKLYLLDQVGVGDLAVLEESLPQYEWTVAESKEQIKEAVEKQEIAAGFVITAPDTYDYYVYNRKMDDEISEQFDEVMQVFYYKDYCAKNNLDYEEVEQMYQTDINVNEQILNKDTRANYFYCYIFVILVFMMIVMYGQMIAVSITNEKSNRAMEVLVTSTSPNSLLFGKVVAGAIGGILQFGLVIGSILGAYQLNRMQWGNQLDIFLLVPSEVLITFAFFGLGGYLFYAFLYGAVGAMASKPEDISKSSGGLMTVIMMVYIFSLVQLNDVDGRMIKILSFLPISSYSTMFARIAMGSVQTWELIVSFMILVISILGAGFIGAKIYRLGTLRYGNPIKLSAALKAIRKENH